MTNTRITDPEVLEHRYPVRVARSPLAPVEAGPAVRLEVVLPSEARPGDASWVLVKAKDSGGNAAKAYRGTVRLESDAVLEGLPRVYRFTPRDEGFHRFSVTPASATGSYRVRATDADQPRLDAASNLLTIVSDSALHPYCGDLHGQHNRGNATAEQYARFARDFGGADFMSWAVNDFHLTQANWDNINRLSALLNEPGRFVVFPGYEWSATTSRGGDHNVIYKTEGMPLLRSGYVEHDLRGYDPETDRYTVPDLLASLDPELALVMPHIGGRRADLDWFDPEFMPFIEVYSSHGQFEWFLREAIERGLPAGFVASSDDAFGKPGDSPPGASGLFAVHGGLTCVYAEALNRDALWDAFRARRVYGTTGERIQLRFRAGPQWMGEVVSDQGPVTISVVTSGTAPIERVEIFRNLERVHVVDAADGRPADRLRIAWRGASSKERARQSLWRGTIRLSQGTIESIEPLRLDQPNERIERTGGGELAFDSVTSGDEDGVIVSLGGDYAQATLTLTASLRSRNQFGAEGGGRQDVDLELPMTELLAAGATRRLDGVDQAIDIRPMGSAYPDSVAVDWTEPDAVAGHSAYWVRVTQVDGATAWSSPIFVRR